MFIGGGWRKLGTILYVLASAGKGTVFQPQGLLWVEDTDDVV